MPLQRYTSSATRRSEANDKSANLLQLEEHNALEPIKTTSPNRGSRGGQKKSRVPKRSPLNKIPTQQLDVYVFGTNCYGELGLGDLTKKTEISRPVLNEKLAADTVGAVQVAVGGVHSAALTRDNRILTWGVNDEGTLARDTRPDSHKETEDTKNTNSQAGSEDSDDDEVALNLKEATPAPVNPSLFPKGTIFAQLAASDSATFALTADGLLYGWGTFRAGNGDIGFSPVNKKQQRIPVLISGLENIVKVVAGAQHALALTSNGVVFSWGCDEQNQLGRRRATRHHQTHPLSPEQCALPSGIRDIGVGLYHSFAVHENDTVYAWGSNNFGQTGVSSSAGQNDAIVPFPTEVRSFRNHPTLVTIFGGKDHSIAITDSGQCLIWGRIDNKALGIRLEDMPLSDIIHDKYGRPRILKQPTLLKGISGKAIFATAGTDHSFIITDKGKAYSWGFNAHSQTGQYGVDEVEKPTLLYSKYLEGKKLVSAAAGGQFSIVVGVGSMTKSRK